MKEFIDQVDNLFASLMTRKLSPANVKEILIEAPEEMYNKIAEDISKMATLENGATAEEVAHLNPPPDVMSFRYAAYTVHIHKTCAAGASVRISFPIDINLELI